MASQSTDLHVQSCLNKIAADVHKLVTSDARVSVATANYRPTLQPPYYVVAETWVNTLRTFLERPILQNLPGQIMNRVLFEDFSRGVFRENLTLGRDYRLFGKDTAVFMGTIFGFDCVVKKGTKSLYGVSIPLDAEERRLCLTPNEAARSPQPRVMGHLNAVRIARVCTGASTRAPTQSIHSESTDEPVQQEVKPKRARKKNRKGSGASTGSETPVEAGRGKKSAEMGGQKKASREREPCKDEAEKMWTGPPRGLKNPDVLCYINASLQLLAAVLEKGGIFQRKLRHMSEGEHCPFSAELEKVLRGSSETEFSSPDFLEMLLGSPHFPKSLFVKGEQHDAAEFLTVLLNFLQDTWKGHGTPEEKKKRAEQLKELEETLKRNNEKLGLAKGLAFSDSKWLQHKAANGGELTDTFGGQVSYRKVCSHCNAPSFSCDPFMHLSLPVPAADKHESKRLDESNPTPKMLKAMLGPKKRRKKANTQKQAPVQDEPTKKAVTLLDCFQDLLAEEVIQDFKCENCGEKGSANQQTRVSHAPEVLLLQLKRFDLYGRKVTTKVDFPWEFSKPRSGATLSNLLPNEESYQLVGHTVHVGASAGHGHYLSYVERGGQWYRCDDLEIVKVDVEEVRNPPRGEPYVLIYRKAEGGKGAEREREKEEEKPKGV